MPRRPLQPRGQARFDQVLEVARELLNEDGLAGFSIPAIAQRTQFTRASIYNFFPTPHSILNELARQELAMLEERIEARGLEHGQGSWRQRILDTVRDVAQFYEQRPIARQLLLGDGVTDEAFRAQTLTIRHLGTLVSRLFEGDGLCIPEHPVDVVSLAIELATTCLRHSVFLHGRITAEYAAEAAQVMVQYLQPYVQQQAPAEH